MFDGYGTISLFVIVINCAYIVALGILAHQIRQEKPYKKSIGNLVAITAIAVFVYTFLA